MALTHDDVREILEIIDSAGPAEIQVETDGFSLHVVIGEPGSARTPAPARESAGPAVGESTEPSVGAPDGLAVVESPMLGTFYRAEGPGKPPFVEVGSTVEPDSVVCIIEVMKMMNSVTAGVAGKIVDICPDNGVLVEFGEPLFRVEAQ